MAEKNFEGCGGLELTHEITITIAGHACTLLLHRDTDYYPKLDTVLVYPGAFVTEKTVDEFGSVAIQGEEILEGEAWQDGVVILAWDDIRRGARGRRKGFNVVIHEFAHQLDMENGAADGFPEIADRALCEAWPRVLQREFDQLNDDLDKGRHTLIDSYGAESPAEFFAVISECFFELPIELSRRHTELYGLLKQFYRQDPAAVVAGLRQQPPDV